MKNKEDSNYDFIASFYDIIIGPFLKHIRKQVVEITHLEEHDSVLEVASGTGEQAIIFTRRGTTVTGLDISDAMLKIARQKIIDHKGSLNLIHADATNLKFEDNKFDLSTITLALHEMDPSVRTQVVDEMIRVTKDEGRIVIVDYTIPRSNNIMSSICRVVIKIIERIAGGEHYKNYRDFMKKGGLYGLIKKHNLQIQEERIAYGGNLGILKLTKNLNINGS